MTDEQSQHALVDISKLMLRLRIAEKYVEPRYLKDYEEEADVREPVGEPLAIEWVLKRLRGAIDDSLACGYVTMPTITYIKELINHGQLYNVKAFNPERIQPNPYEEGP